MALIFHNDVIFYLIELVNQKFDEIVKSRNIDENTQVIKDITVNINHYLKNKYRQINRVKEISIISYLYCNFPNPNNKKMKIFPATKEGRISPWKTSSFFIPKDTNHHFIIYNSMMLNQDLIRKINKSPYQQEFINGIINSYNDKLCINDNLNNIMNKFKIFKTEVIFILVQNNILYFKKDFTLHFKKTNNDQIGENTMIGKLNNYISKSEIDKVRKETGELYDHYGEHNMILSNEGTGSGKSFHTVDKYFDFDKLKDEHRVFVFSAPQKTQLKIAPHTFEKAKGKIEILYAKGSNELTNFDQAHLASYLLTEKDYENIEDVYNNMFKLLNSSISNKIIAKIKSGINKRKKDSNEYNEEDDLFLAEKDIKSLPKTPIEIKNMFHFLKSKKDEFEREKNSMSRENKEIIEELSINFQMDILKLTQAIITYYSDSEIKEIINNKKEKTVFEQFFYDFIKFMAPFEFAKYQSCLIIMTVAKTDHACFYSDVNEKDDSLKTIRRERLDYIASSCHNNYGAGVFEIINENQEKIKDYLQNDYFKVRNQSYFYKNNILFSIAFDEEHIAYNSKVEKSFQSIFYKSTNIIHALCGLQRMYSQCLELKRSNRKQGLKFSKKENNTLKKEREKIIKSLINNFKIHTVLNSDIKIKNFFDAISNNTQGIHISREDEEFISSTFRNLVTLNNNIILNSKSLEGIRVTINSLDGAAIYLDKDINNNTELLNVNDSELIINMHEFIQIILMSLYTLRETPKKLKSEIKREIEYHDNQDEPLYNVIVQATKHRNFLESLMFSNKNINSETKVNNMFSYFLPKILFELQTGRYGDLIADDDYSIKGKLDITLINEQPEVGILRILTKKGNKVFLLSATRGFNDCYSGNFNTTFFNTMNKKYYDGKLISISLRGSGYNPAEKLTELKFKDRKSVSISKIIFNSNKANIDRYNINDISSLSNKKEGVEVFKETHDFLINSKKNVFFMKEFDHSVDFGVNINSILRKYSSPYHKQEFKNIINSIAHCFYENKNGLILSLTNKAIKEFLSPNIFATSMPKNENNLKDSDGIYYDGKGILTEKNENKIFSFRPMKISSENKDDKNYKRRVKLVFFDSELGKDKGFSESIKIDDNTNLIIISSYNSAGVGLNLTPKEDIDFNSLYFVSKPFWSGVKDRDKGFNSTSNLLLLFRRMAASETEAIGDISGIMRSRKTKRILAHEHEMELLKYIIQGAGRIEREFCNIDTSVYFVDSEVSTTFNDVMLKYTTFYNAETKIKNGALIRNISFVNKSILKTALLYTDNKSMGAFKRVLQRDTREMFEVNKQFFENDFIVAKIQYEKGNNYFSWFKDFNDIIRGMVSPEYDIVGKIKTFLELNVNMLANPNCLFYEKIENLSDNLIYHIPEEHIGKPLMIDYENNCFTDITFSEKPVLYRPTSLYKFLETEEYLKTNKTEPLKDFVGDSEFYNLPIEIEYLKEFNQKYLSKINTDVTDKNIKYIPNIYLQSIIKGNIGELIFKLFVEFLNEKKEPDEQIDLDYFSIKYPTIARKIYEVFDFYIIKDNKLLCFDIKNWALGDDNLLKKTGERIENKISKIKNAVDELKKLGVVNDYSLLYVNIFNRNSYSSTTDELINNHYLNGKATFVSLISKERDATYLKINSSGRLTDREKIKIYEKEIPLKDALSIKLMGVLL